MGGEFDAMSSVRHHVHWEQMARVDEIEELLNTDCQSVKQFIDLLISRELVIETLKLWLDTGGGEGPGIVAIRKFSDFARGLD